MLYTFALCQENCQLDWVVMLEFSYNLHADVNERFNYLFQPKGSYGFNFSFTQKKFYIHNIHIKKVDGDY